MCRVKHAFSIAVVAIAAAHAFAPARGSNPAETIANSQQVLSELVAIPGRQIPARLLSEAQGIAIVPRVIKIGFVAGVRRGFGVVMARDNEGAWSLPRFIRLTGGSVGWQAGVQGTDVVLVFRTRRSMESLLRGRFTVGVDAAAAAGPVGRNAAAATDLRLQAEILSYSRSRGLFLGASVDGSVIELDQVANTSSYGSPDVENPLTIPPAATRLQAFVAELTGGGGPVVEAAVAAPTSAPGAVVQTAALAPITDLRKDALRASLAAEWGQLAPLLSQEWQAFLALPADALNPAAPPDLPALADTLARYDRVAGDAQFAALSSRPEFQSLTELLRAYVAALGATSATLQLPAPPPMVGGARR
jgi:lipid-binding SYLF domain-containing protein